MRKEKEKVCYLVIISCWVLLGVREPQQLR